ncbi:MAG: hypothetical protein ACI4RC_02900 [Oscillospiraceae bacterium]
MHRNFLKFFTIFVLGALIYGSLEVLARGFTHITMGLLGGFSMIVIHQSNTGRREGLNYFVQLFLITFFITAIEFFSGEVFNVMLGMNIWDYSDMAVNIDGQICMIYSLLWLVLAAIGIAFDDFIRWKLFREDKNFSYIQLPSLGTSRRTG